MKRYFAPKVGTSSASKEALAMFNDKNKRTIVAVATHSRYISTISRLCFKRMLQNSSANPWGPTLRQQACGDSSEGGFV